MSEMRKQKVDQLADALERLWFGGGDYGVATDANQREKMRRLLHELMDDSHRVEVPFD
jgi:hypothetical protein